MKEYSFLKMSESKVVKARTATIAKLGLQDRIVEQAWPSSIDSLNYARRRPPNISVPSRQPPTAATLDMSAFASRRRTAAARHKLKRRHGWTLVVSARAGLGPDD